MVLGVFCNFKTKFVDPSLPSSDLSLSHLSQLAGPMMPEVIVSPLDRPRLGWSPVTKVSPLHSWRATFQGQRGGVHHIPPGQQPVVIHCLSDPFLGVTKYNLYALDTFWNKTKTQPLFLICITLFHITVIREISFNEQECNYRKGPQVEPQYWWRQMEEQIENKINQSPPEIQELQHFIVYVAVVVLLAQKKHVLFMETCVLFKNNSQKSVFPNKERKHISASVLSLLGFLQGSDGEKCP